MFEAKLNDISLLRDSISTISDIIDESEIAVKKDGIEILCADRTVVTVVKFFLSKDAFDEYKCENETKIGINLPNFLQILKRAKPEDRMIMKLEENMLKVYFESNIKRNFSLPLINISKEELPSLEKLEAGFNAKVEINTDILNHGIEDAELVSDSLVFTIQKDGMMLNSKTDASSSHLELKPGSDLNILSINEPVRARYSLDYLKKIIKARKLSPKAQLSMASDYPMKLSFSIPNKLELSFILAPRVEDV